MSTRVATIAAASTTQNAQSAAFFPAASNGVSSAPTALAPRTPSVIAPTVRNTTAAIATPPTIPNGMARRGSLTSLAMIAARMNPSHDQKKIAAPASNPSGPLSPRIGPRFAGSTAPTAAPLYNASRPTRTASSAISIFEVSSMPKTLRPVIPNTAIAAARCAGRPGIAWLTYVANASAITLIETSTLPR